MGDSRRALRCGSCGRVTLISEPSDVRAEVPAVREALLVGQRLEFGEPVAELVAFPLVFALAWLLSMTSLGRLFVFPVQIWFHELGHAIPSWLSGRAALPLPCGITFTSAEPSLFTGLCFVFLLGVLGYAGYRERRAFAVVLSGVFLALTAYFSLVLDAARSFELFLLGGIAGELWLSTLVAAAFYFPLPDRLRWDVFRWLGLLFAALTFAGTTRLWVAIAAGRERMPLGSLFGAHGDGSGDLDRLMAGYGWTREGLVDLYLGMAGASGLVLVGLYLFFALRAARALRER